MDNSSYTQKPVRERNSLAWEIALIVAVGLLLSWGIASAYVMDGSFESYPLADINGVDSWVGGSGDFIVCNDEYGKPVHEGLQTIGANAGLSHWLRWTEAQGEDWDKGILTIYANDRAWEGDCQSTKWARLEVSDTLNSIENCYIHVDLKQENCEGGHHFENWVKVDIQWVNSTKMGRVCFDGSCEEWESFASETCTTSVIKYFRIGASDGIMWMFDTLSIENDMSFPDENKFHTLVLSAYPNLSQVGTIFTTTIENESYLSVLNSYYVKLYNGESEGFSYLENQYLSIATTTYHLYEHTGTTTIHISTATTTQSSGSYPTDSSSDCWDNPWNDDHSCVYWQSVPENTPTYFDTDLMTPGKTYFLKFEITFDPLDYIASSTITISDSSWTEHWILYGEYDILTDTYEFASPDDYDIMVGTDPFEYDEGLSTTTGGLILELGTWLKGITKYLSFLVYKEGTFTFNVIEFFTNPRGSLEKIISNFDIREKIPFSYFTEIRDLVADELENIGDYSATTTEGVMVIPYIGSVKIFNIYQVKITYATPLANLRTIIEYSLWIGFIFYIWRKIKSFGR